MIDIKMKLMILVLLAVGCWALEEPQDWFDQEWEAWKEKHGRVYKSPEEEVERRGIWEDNVNLVEEVNNRDDVTFTVEMNRFADGILMGRPKINVKSSFVEETEGEEDEELSALPPSFDWRKKDGVISPVQNQGELGGASAVAAEECVQSLHFIETGQTADLSQAEVQDCCSTIYDTVFDCIHRIGGLCGESSYPTSTGHCRNSSCQPEVQINGGKVVAPGRPFDMMKALLDRPLIAYLDASRPSFQTYTMGIYSDPDCSKTSVDHAVQIVGYGEEDGQEFWICKNSWGTSWGENGYFRILRGVDMCAVEKFVSYPF